MYESPQFLSLTVAMFSYVIFFPVSLISYTKPKNTLALLDQKEEEKKKYLAGETDLSQKFRSASPEQNTPI